MFPRLNHIGLLASDLEKARHFYSNILGLLEIKRPPFSIEGLWYSLGSFDLHIMLYEKTKHSHFHLLNETVQSHFALEFTKIQISEILERLKKAKIQLIEPPSPAPTNEFQAFFYDFDKNMIEINCVKDTN